MLGMVKVVPQILRQFDLELQDPTSEWEIDSGWFVKQKYSCTESSRDLLKELRSNDKHCVRLQAKSLVINHSLYLIRITSPWAVS